MTVLDKIKSFFKLARSPKITGEKPPDAAGGKPAGTVKEGPHTATVKKPAKTTQSQRKASKATGKKPPRTSKRKRTR